MECNLGTVGAGAEKIISVRALTTKQGTLTNTAVVTCSNALGAPDPLCTKRDTSTVTVRTEAQTLMVLLQWGVGEASGLNDAIVSPPIITKYLPLPPPPSCLSGHTRPTSTWW